MSLAEIKSAVEELSPAELVELAAFIRERDSDPSTAKASFNVRSFAGHRVLTPVVSQSDLADEMFGTR